MVFRIENLGNPALFPQLADQLGAGAGRFFEDLCDFAGSNSRDPSH